VSDASDVDEICGTWLDSGRFEADECDERDGLCSRAKGPLLTDIVILDGRGERYTSQRREGNPTRLVFAEPLSKFSTAFTRELPLDSRSS
jgi:hypothetical protein